jgi:hypothetical protein
MFPLVYFDKYGAAQSQGFARAEGCEDCALALVHDSAVLLCLVVVADKVQSAVHAQEEEVVVQRNLRLVRLRTQSEQRHA